MKSEPGEGDLLAGAAGGAWELSIPNQLAAVGEANRLLEDHLQRQGAGAEVVFSSLLLLEEAVTNIIKYAYADGLEHVIRIEATIAQEKLRLRISDDGRAFDPLTAPPPDLDRPLEERPEGGLGVHLMRRLTEDITYERKRGSNVLTLVLSMSSTPNRREL